MGLFSKKTKTTSKTEPYAPVIPYINDFLGDSAKVFDNAPQFSDTELQGYDAVRSAATAPSAISGATQQLNKTLSGDYLSPESNPYIADIAKRISGIAGQNINSTFGGRGRTGSGLAGYYAGKGISDSISELYSGNYENERGRQFSAVSQAPGLESSKFIAPQALVTAGQNISARPFDINQQRSGILSQIGQLGQQGQSTTKSSGGLLGTIAGSFVNRLFPGA